MVSTQQSSRAEQVASNAWPWADGGSIFADAPNAHIGCCDSSPNQHASKHHAATGHPIITSFERGDGGFAIIVRGNSSPARSFPLLTRIRWITRRPDRRERCPQIGKRCFTNRMHRNPFLGAMKLGVRGGHIRGKLVLSIEILKRSERFVP